MSTVTLYKPHPDPWHAFREDDPLGDAMAPPSAPYSVSKIAEEGVARYCARSFDLPVTIARMCAAYSDQSGLPVWHLDAIAAGEPVRTRWDPMPYSPIHDDDICAQLEPLLGVASVPATIVNWGGDEPVSVQEYAAYFGELLGVDADVVVEEIPGASRGSVGDQTKRSSITGPCRIGWREGFRRVAEHLYPGSRPGRRQEASGMTENRYPSGDQLLAEAMQATGLLRLRAGRLPRGPRRAAREPRARRRPQPRDRRRRDRRSPATPRQPPRGRGVVPRASRDRGARGAGAGRHQRTPAHRHHGPRQHDVARSAVPRPARVGAIAAVPAADDRERGHGSATAAARGGERAAVGRAARDAPLRRRRDDGGHRAARHGVPRAAVHASRLRLSRLVARRGHDVDVRLPPAHRQAPALATPAGPVALQGAPPQLPPRSDRVGLSRTRASS